MADRFDHLPGQLRKACPHLPVAAVDMVMATIAKARNDWVTQTIKLVSTTVLSADDATDEDLPNDSHENA